MPQSLAKLAVHLIFSTRNRTRALLSATLRADLRAYLAGILNNQDCPCILAGAAADHVHILYLQSRTRSLADIVGAVKRDSSVWLKTQAPVRTDPALLKFHWQDGYGAFSVSESRIAEVKTYIGNQEEHHKRHSFQDEYRAVLRRHAVDYNEQYVWD